jgi:hypothetical protein
MILALPAASTFAVPLPIAWEGRSKLWKQAFNKIPALKAHQGRAIAFMGKVIDEAKDDRNFATHAPEPTARARTINPRKGHPDTVDVRCVALNLETGA